MPGSILARSRSPVSRRSDGLHVELDVDALADQDAPGLEDLVPPEDLRERRLERVLRDWDAPSTPVHVVYPSARHISPKVKTFVDPLQGRMTPPPWELGPMP